MNDASTWVWLNERDFCSARHLGDVSGLSDDELDDLIANGVIVPSIGAPGPRAFQLHYVVTATLARRLRDDFELDRHGLALAMTLMRRIDELQGELNAARGRRD